MGLSVALGGVFVHILSNAFCSRQIECSAESIGVREPPDTIPAHYTPGPVCVYNLLLSALTAQETRSEGTGEHDSDLENVRCPFPAGPVI